MQAKFTGSCLKQDKVIFNHGKVVNIYIVYELGASNSSSSDTTLKNCCLFGAVTLTLFRIDFCGAAQDGGSKRTPPTIPKICHIFCNGET